MIIRQSQHSDQSILHHIKSLYETETGGSVSTKSIDHLIVWVAVQETQIVSAVFIDILNDFAELPIIFTLPKFRNLGIGSQLLHEVITWAKHYPLKKLVLWPTTLSLPFYTRLGFPIPNNQDFPLQLPL